MAATAGYSTVVQYSADDVSYASISGIKSASGPFDADELDSSAFLTGQWRTRIQGLKSMDIKLDGFWDTSTEQAALRSAFTSGADIYLKVKWDGTIGFKVKCKVFSFEVSPAVDTLVPITFDLMSVEAPTFVS